MGKSIKHAPLPGAAPMDSVPSLQAGKDPKYFNTQRPVIFPRGVEGTDESGRSFGSGIPVDNGGPYGTGSG
jgi:hypothetical protein